MKRLLVFVLCFVTLISISACSDPADSTVPSSSESEQLHVPGMTEFSATASQGLDYEVNPDGISCTVTGIGECQDLYITIGDSMDGYPVTAIGDSAFYCNTDIQGILIGKHVERIGSYAFFECAALRVVTLGDGVATLGQYAFAGCTKLETIALPKSVTQLDAWAFYDCYRLKSVQISSMQQWLSISFGGPYANPLQCAGELYVNDRLLTELVIPEDMETIGAWVMAGCTSLTSVTIPVGVLEISQRAFAQCENLTEIRYDGTVDAWNAIDKRSYWDFSMDDYIVRCSDGEVK